MQINSFSFKSWIARHWTTLVIVFVLVASFAYRHSVQKKRAKEDLLFKDTLYSKWLKDPLNNEHFEELTKLLDRNKEMHKNYDASIAQKLLEIGGNNKVSRFSKTPLKRLKEEFPMHAAFVESSILIAEKKYLLALEKSYDIHQKMETTGSLLKIYNLLRIALLEKNLNHKEEEFTALNELKNLLEAKSIPEQKDVVDYLIKRIEILQK